MYSKNPPSNRTKILKTLWQESDYWNYEVRYLSKAHPDQAKDDEGLIEAGLDSFCLKWRNNKGFDDEFEEMVDFIHGRCLDLGAVEVDVQHAKEYRICLTKAGD